MAKLKIQKPKPTARKVSVKKQVQNDGNYMTINELCDLLKMSKSHIYTLTSTQQIPHIKILGKKLLFDKKDIENWLQSKKVAAK